MWDRKEEIGIHVPNSETFRLVEGILLDLGFCWRGTKGRIPMDCGEGTETVIRAVTDKKLCYASINYYKDNFKNLPIFSANEFLKEMGFSIASQVETVLYW